MGGWKLILARAGVQIGWKTWHRICPFLKLNHPHQSIFAQRFSRKIDQNINVKKSKIPLENGADQLAERNVDTRAERNVDMRADRNVDTRADRPKNSVNWCIHGKHLLIFVGFSKNRFSGFTRCKTIIFWGANQKQKKNGVKKENHPHLSIFGRQKKGGQKRRLAHGITTFDETRTWKKEEEKKEEVELIY